MANLQRHFAYRDKEDFDGGSLPQIDIDQRHSRGSTVRDPRVAPATAIAAGEVAALMTI